ncbi:MAG: hypothetical protein AB3N16_00350, partial [Flavobacteriaceae bacterium]
MLGLFKGKKDQRDEKLNQPEYFALVQKWEIFLKKIEERFHESLVHAEEAVLENLEVSNFDLTPTLTSWQGIKAQLMQLMDKSETTFDEKVKPQMLEFIEEWEVIDEEHKGTHLREAMYEQMERFEIVMEGKASLKFYEHALTLLNEHFHCSQCQAQLEVKKDIFRSHYVSCDYCNTVNTFTPNDKIAQIKWVVDNIAKYRAIGEWDAMREAHNQYIELPCKATHEDQSELLEAFRLKEDKERCFWEKFLSERYTLLPEYKDSFEHDLMVKMKHLTEEKE